MILRYRQPGGNAYTRTFDENGKALGKFRIAIVRGGKVLTGNALYNELQKSLYPDVPFGVRMPVVKVPKYHWDWVEIEEPQPEGFIIIKKVYTKVWDVTEEDYQAALLLFEQYLRQWLVFAEEYYLPVIPDSPGTIWELVDMSKPYPERYTRIPVEVGRFRGNFFKVVDRDELYKFYAVTFGTSSNATYSITRK